MQDKFNVSVEPLSSLHLVIAAIFCCSLSLIDCSLILRIHTNLSGNTSYDLNLEACCDWPMST